MGSCTLDNGTTCFFWSHVWNAVLLQQKYPRLYTFAKDKTISAAEFILIDNHITLFNLPLSMAYQELHDLQQFIQQLQLQGQQNADSWQYQCGNKPYWFSKF